MSCSPVRKFDTRAACIGFCTFQRSYSVWSARSQWHSGLLGWVIAAISISLAILLALRAWFIRWMTEIVVTDRRVIYAHGFIQRHSVEVHMDKIESVDVDQGMLGRVFDYGDVTIRGTGTTMEPLQDVDRPIAFRNEVTAR